MEELRKEIMNGMCGYINDDQMERLGNILDIVMHDYEVRRKTKEVILYDDSNDAKLRKFIATKRLKGLSENSLEQYCRVVNNMMIEIGKPLDNISTDDVRYYLSMYQSKRNVSKVTLNNMRRYLSTFFNWCTNNWTLSAN